MSRIGVETSAKNIRTKIGQFVEKMADLKTQTEYKRSHVIDLATEFHVDFSTSILADAKNFVNLVAGFKKDVFIRQEKESKAYRPLTDLAEIAYHSKKQDFVREAELVSADDIFADYDKALEFGLEEKIQMYEDSGAGILSKMDKGKAIAFKTKVEQNRSSRWSEALIKDVEIIPKFEQLARVADRMKDGAFGGKIPEVTLYSFYSMAGESGDATRLTASQVRSAFVI